MHVFDTVIDAIGRTPLVRLNKVVPEGAATILAKCEFMNPAGSIKDRIARHIIEEAERRGDLKPGGVIVENTSGNTGLGLAMVAAVKGYRCVFTMPDKMSREKIDAMKAFGAEVIVTPTDVPGDSPEHYVNRAKAIAADTPGGYYVNQYHSPLNIDAHYRSTGPEIWEQTGGGFDVFMGATGTGGTVSGVARYIKERQAAEGGDRRVVGVDILGSVHYHLFHTGTMPTPYIYQVEGIGEDIRCEAMDFTHVDDMVQVDDRESFHMARRLVREEGLACGGSSGSIVAAAVKLATELGAYKTIVVTLCDNMSRYVSKYLSDDWMRDRGLLDATSDLGQVSDLLTRTGRPVLTVGPTSPVSEVVELLKREGVSQVPVREPGYRPTHIVHEIDLLRGLMRGTVEPSSPVIEAAQPVAGLVYSHARIEELVPILESDRVAIVVDANELVGIVSNIDLVDFMARRGVATAGAAG